MAIVTAGVFGIDSNAPDVGSLADGDIVGATATTVTIQTGAWLDVFTGSFQYSGSQLVGGTITGWKETFSGQLAFEVTGASVPVTQFLNWVQAGDDLAAVQVFFSGADTMNGSAAADTLSGWAGDDVLRGGDGNDSVFGGTGNDVITDTGGSNYLRGNEGDDNLTGGSGFDDVHGNEGNDTVSGGLGDDWVVGGKDNDLQFGGDGFDVVYGNLGSDTLNGDAGNDWVRGGQQNDVLNGGAGDDWMSGDRDNDTLTGGAGADIFNLFAGAGVDRITDFNLGEGDRIRWEGGQPSNLIIAQSGADTVISYNTSDSVTLVGVQASSLTGTGWWILG